jgi:hypothetical protein
MIRARDERGSIVVNITVKAPPGERYDVDVQKVKERYIRWWYSVLAGVVLYFVAGYLWLLFTHHPPKGIDFFNSLVDFGKYLVLTWYG